MLLTKYSHPPKASYGVAPLRRTTAYCLQRRALSETFGGWLYSPTPQYCRRALACPSHKPRATRLKSRYRYSTALAVPGVIGAMSPWRANAVRMSQSAAQAIFTARTIQAKGRMRSGVSRVCGWQGSPLRARRAQHTMSAAVSSSPRVALPILRALPSLPVRMKWLSLEPVQDSGTRWERCGLGWDARRKTQAMWATLPSFATPQPAQSRAHYARDGMLNRLLYQRAESQPLPRTTTPHRRPGRRQPRHL